MLVLTRKPGQSIYMWVEDEKIDVCVISQNGNQVKIGITADKKVRILRDDVIKKNL